MFLKIPVETAQKLQRTAQWIQEEAEQALEDLTTLDVDGLQARLEAIEAYAYTLLSDLAQHLPAPAA